MRLIGAMADAMRFMALMATIVVAILAPIIFLVQGHPVIGGIILAGEIFWVLTWVFYQE